MHDDRGTLYVVATPIGNVEDMSSRAKSVLSDVDIVIAEDTRHSGRLLRHFGIETEMMAFHDYNEAACVQKIIDKLLAGQNIALISDAGTPLINDPGYKLVVAAHNANIRVSPIPGACALISALCVAGLPTDRFVFHGFLPAKQTARQKLLEDVKYQAHTLIFYEAPHRIKASLEDIVSVLGEGRRAVLARELTKLHETVFHGELGQLLERVTQDPDQSKGEIVLLITGNTAEAAQEAGLDYAALLDELLPVMPLKQAVKIVVNVSGLPKNKIYDLALEKSDKK